MIETYDCTVPGKWVLAGEHTVLRGGSAIALPHPEFRLSIRYESSTEASEADSLQILPPEIGLVVQDILKSAEVQLKKPEGTIRSQLKGTLKLSSTIALGAGLGSSAALCVALTKWLALNYSIADENLFSMAKTLEDQFHGKSSGMDVAVALIGKPLRFRMNQAPEVLKPFTMPKFTFHDTTLRMRTSQCVAKVSGLHDSEPKKAFEIDQIMMNASEEAHQGLISQDKARVAQAMRLSQTCFKEWGLLPPEAQDLERQLLAQGALAVKLTGAGGGGFLVALWD